MGESTGCALPLGFRREGSAYGVSTEPQGFPAGIAEDNEPDAYPGRVEGVGGDYESICIDSGLAGSWCSLG